jgi:predicted O-methyltransferase YrrM
MPYDGRDVPGYDGRASLRASEVLKRFDVTKDLVGAEVGVYYGAMSKALLEQAPRLILYMIDSWQVGAPSNRKRAESNTDPTRRVILAMPSLEAIRHVPDLDFVFIDADHSYPAVKADIAAWMPKVKVGGWLCGHDYDLRAVKRAVDGLPNVELGQDTTWFVKRERD